MKGFQGFPFRSGQLAGEGARSFPPAVGFHGPELEVILNMQALRQNFFEIPMKIDSFYCLKF